MPRKNLKNTAKVLAYGAYKMSGFTLNYMKKSDKLFAKTNVRIEEKECLKIK